MKPAALLFVLAVLSSAAGWGLLVAPVHGQALGLAEELAAADVPALRAASSRDPGPGAAEAGKLAAAVALFQAPSPAQEIPRGLAEEEPGRYAGRLEWNQVQGLFSWAAGQDRPVLDLEVRAREGDPEHADCRVVLGKGPPR